MTHTQPGYSDCYSYSFGRISLLQRSAAAAAAAALLFGLWVIADRLEPCTYRCRFKICHKILTCDVKG